MSAGRGRRVLLGPFNSDAARGKETALPRQVLLGPSNSDAARGKETALPRQVLLGPSNSDAARGKGGSTQCGRCTCRCHMSSPSIQDMDADILGEQVIAGCTVLGR